MRIWLGVLAATAVLSLTSGTAHADVPRTGDGDGVLVGSPIAPVQLEIFCEPQCPHCAELESADGDGIADGISSGRLAVTYRWLTFLDDKHHNDASARMTNALFLAADPTTSPTAYQAFVQDLYRHQSADGPDNNDLASMARQSGLSDAAADRIAAGDNTVDTNAVNAANRARLNASTPKPGTPTVYNLTTRSVVDLQDSDWLDKL